MKTYGVVLLAAGSSARLGSPKQLLKYNGRSLISHAAETAVRSAADMITVVIGGYAASLSSELEKFPVRVVFNPQFSEGMASSVSIGLKSLEAHDLDGVIFMVCDQPFVSADLINELISKGRESDNYIAACSYGESIGVPALFSKKYFPELLQLAGREGAKKLLKQYADKVIPVSFPQGIIDIDTAGDYEKLLAGDGT